MWFTRFISSEDGATAVEYAVILALIIAATLTSVTFVGKKTGNNFRQIKKALVEYAFLKHQTRLLSEWVAHSEGQSLAIMHHALL